VFRRKPNISPYHSIYVDEFPDYVYEEFASFTAQSRKYKAPVIIVAQTVAQLSRKVSDDFLHTLLATCRNKFVYGDEDEKTASLFSAMFGESEQYEESETEQTVSSYLEGSTKREGVSYSKKKDVIMTPQDIIYQDKFVCAVKIVSDNKPIPVKQIKANFVPKNEFKEAKILADKEQGFFWLERRREWLADFNNQDSFNKSLDDSDEELLEKEQEEVEQQPSASEGEEEVKGETEHIKLNRGSTRPRSVVTNLVEEQETASDDSAVAVLDTPSQKKDTIDHSQAHEDSQEIVESNSPVSSTESIIIEEDEEDHSTASTKDNRSLSLQEKLAQEHQTNESSGEPIIDEGEEVSLDDVFSFFGEEEESKPELEEQPEAEKENTNKTDREYSEPNPLFEQEVEQFVDQLHKEDE